MGVVSVVDYTIARGKDVHSTMFGYDGASSTLSPSHTLSLTDLTAGSVQYMSVGPPDKGAECVHRSKSGYITDTPRTTGAGVSDPRWGACTTTTGRLPAGERTTGDVASSRTSGNKAIVGAGLVTG